jgi:hypothetical protein
MLAPLSTLHAGAESTAIAEGGAYESNLRGSQIGFPQKTRRAGKKLNQHSGRQRQFSDRQARNHAPDCAGFHFLA